MSVILSLAVIAAVVVIVWRHGQRRRDQAYEEWRRRWK